MALNEQEALQYQETMRGITKDFMRDIEDLEPGAYETFVATLKTETRHLFKEIEDVDVQELVATVRDPEGRSLLGEVSEDVEEEASRDAEEIQRDLPQPLGEADVDLLSEVLTNISTAHEAAATACSRLAVLVTRVNPANVMPILAATTRPLVQLNLPDRLTPAAPPKKSEETQYAKALPRPTHRNLKPSKKTLGARLLAALIHYSIGEFLDRPVRQDTLVQLFTLGQHQVRKIVTGRVYGGGRHYQQKKKQRQQPGEEPMEEQEAEAAPPTPGTDQPGEPTQPEPTQQEPAQQEATPVQEPEEETGLEGQQMETDTPQRGPEVDTQAQVTPEVQLQEPQTRSRVIGEVKTSSPAASPEHRPRPPTPSQIPVPTGPGFGRSPKWLAAHPPKAPEPDIQVTAEKPPISGRKKSFFTAEPVSPTPPPSRGRGRGRGRGGSYTGKKT